MPDARITVTPADGPPDQDPPAWLVNVELDGMLRIVARCPYRQYADVVATGLRALNDDTLRQLAA